MKDSYEWTTIPSTGEPVGLTAETEYKYAIPYSWGALHVTEQADEAYSFVPLSADMVKYDQIDHTTRSELGVRTDIYLLSPQEYRDQLPDSPVPPSDIDYEAAVLGYPTLHDKGIELRLAMSDGTEQVNERRISQLAKFVEENGIDLEQMPTIDNIPIDEVLRHRTPQATMVMICGLAGEIIQPAFEESLKAAHNKENLKVVTKLGAAGIAGAGLMLGLSGAIRGEISLNDVSATMALSGVYAYWARDTIKHNLSVGNVLDRVTHGASMEYANRVADDIYKTYSTDYFDSQFGEN